MMARYVDANLVKEALIGWETDPTDEEIEYTIDKIPTADAAEVIHAKWIINSDGYYPYCSNCKNEPDYGIMSYYCPICGAKMSGGTE
jgi:hypothetical protein